MTKDKTQSPEEKHKEVLAEVAKKIQQINRSKGGIDLSTVYENLHNVLSQYASKISFDEFEGIMSSINYELVQTFDKRIDEPKETPEEIKESEHQFLEVFSDILDVFDNLDATKSFLSLIHDIISDENMSEEDKQAHVDRVSSEFEQKHAVNIDGLVKDFGKGASDDLKDIISKIGNVLGIDAKDKEVKSEKKPFNSFVDMITNHKSRNSGQEH